MATLSNTPHLGSRIGLCLLRWACAVGCCMGSTGALSHALQPDVRPHSMAPVLRDVIPAVVNVRTETRLKPTLNPAPSHGSSQHSINRVTGLGSGVILHPDPGYVLTNFHVVKEADHIRVTLHDGRHLSAHLVAGDPESDVAVLHVHAKHLMAMPLGDSDALEVGDFVMAIGSPFGLSQSVTSGMISALSRHIGLDGYENFIQTDAPINPGHSGGALIDSQGRLIGINTAILTPDGGNVGIGFAIPINMARNIADQLIQFGHVRRGLLGVVVQDLTPDLADALDTPNQVGALVDQIMPDSMAAQAELLPGDIITGINGHRIRSAAHLRHAVGLVPIGESLHIERIRKGQTDTRTLIMQDPAEHTHGAQRIFAGLAGSLLVPSHHVQTLEGDMQGILVLGVRPGTPAWEQGLRKHDVIVSANQQPCSQLEQLHHAAQQRDSSLLLRVLRDQKAFFLLLKKDVV